MTIIIIDGKRITYPILDPERSLVFSQNETFRQLEKSCQDQ